MIRPLVFCSILITLSCFGCGSNWMALRVDEVSYSDLYQLTCHVIDREGFKLSHADPHLGTIRSSWNYNKITDVGRFPIRRQLEATIKREDDAYLVSLRIDQEANRDGYGMSDPELSDSWDEYGWDRKTCETILKKIEIQVKEYGPSDEFYKRFREAEDLKADVPEVLK